MTAPEPAAVRRPGWEVLLVLGVSLGQSAVYSMLSIAEKLTRAVPLGQQTTQINTSVTPDRPWLDLAYQLAGIAFPLVPAILALYLLRLSGDRHRIGFDLERVMCTDYRIDDFQEVYFVLQSLDDLLGLAAIDFAPLYARVGQRAQLRPGDVLTTDRIVQCRDMIAAAKRVRGGSPFSRNSFHTPSMIDARVRASEPGMDFSGGVIDCVAR